VLRLDIVSLHNASRALEHLDGLGITAERVRLVVNRYRQPKELPVRKAEQVLGMNFFHLVPDEPARVNASINNGVPVVIERPRAKVSQSIIELAERVKDLRKAHHGNGHGGVERLFPEGASAVPQ
jgi:pilus assembly protein CpaE